MTLPSAASFQSLLWVGCGSALGGMARYGMSLWIQHQMGARFPWGTLAVNLLGSFLIGCVAAGAAVAGHWLSQPHVQRLVIVGLLGGFTTFSSFSLQTLQLIQQDRWAAAAVNVISSVLCCLLAAWAGFRLGDLLFGES